MGIVLVTRKSRDHDTQGVPCTRLANLILAPKQERQRIAAYIPRWGIQLAAHLSEGTAWAIYRDRLKRLVASRSFYTKRYRAWAGRIAT
jgi:hypothetical protein